jgi:hypothetical protein
MRKFISNLLLSAIFVSLAPGLASQTFTESQNINRSFAVNKSSTVDILNKYGRVQVFRWAKDSARIEIEFRINSTNLSRINRIKSWISFDISGSGSFITAKTVFQSGYTSVINDIVNLAESVVDPSNQVIINYTVHVPEYVDLRVNNKFGDIYIDDFAGRTDITLSNGELKANKLSGKSSIEINFGGGYASDIHDGKLKLSYADFQLKNAGQLYLTSSSSKATIDNVQSLRLDSRRDKIRLNKISEVSGSSYFSELWADEVLEEANLNMKYGSLNFDRINKNFSLIRLSSEYTDVDLFFDNEASYNLDLTYPNDAFVRLPRDIGKFQEKIAEGEIPLKMVYGPVGKNPDKSKVTITLMKKANVSINQR